MPPTGLAPAVAGLVLAAALFSGDPSAPSPSTPSPVRFREQGGNGDYPGPSRLAWGFTEGRIDGERIADVRVNEAGHPRRLASCNTQSETHLVSYRRDVYVGFNDARWCLAPYAPVDPLTWTGFARSTDGGKTFVDDGPLQGNRETPELWGDPVLAVDTHGRGAGTLYVASLARNDEGVFTLGVGVSKDSGRTFRWEDAVTGVEESDGPDKEWLAIDDTGGRHDGNLYLAWTNFADTARESSVQFARSTDGGKTWSKPLNVHRDFGFGVRVVVGPDGTVHVVYESDEDVYWTASSDGGRTFDEPREIADAPAPGAYESTCFRNALNGDMRTFTTVSAAIDALGSARPSDPNHNPDFGSLYVTYHAHGEDADEADVLFLKRDPAGRWTKPRRLNDDETTTDQFQPEVAVPGPGRVAVVWTDRREDAALPAPLGNRRMAQYVATSNDGGKSFGPNRRLSDVLFDPPFSNPSPNLMGGCYAGDYNGLHSTGNGEVLASWADNRDALEVTGVSNRVIPDPNIYFRRERL